MMEETNILDSEYVYIGKDEQYHIKDDAPEELKEKFKEFFKNLKVDDNGEVTLS